MPGAAVVGVAVVETATFAAGATVVSVNSPADAFGSSSRWARAIAAPIPTASPAAAAHHHARVRRDGRTGPTMTCVGSTGELAANGGAATGIGSGRPRSVAAICSADRKRSAGSFAIARVTAAATSPGTSERTRRTSGIGASR